MKKLSKFISEVKSQSQEEAERLGLNYVGFGRWADPKTGKVTHKTEGDRLVPVSSDQEVDTENQTQLRPEAEGEGKKPIERIKDAINPGRNIGGAEEQDPDDDIGWEAGPEGDTCIGDEIPPEGVFDDEFVSKQNNPKWIAGPEGSNFTNVDRQTIVKEPDESQFANNDRHTIVKEEEIKQGELSLDRVTPEQPDPTNRAKERMRKIMGKDPASQKTDREAQSALNKMRGNKDQQEVFGRQLASMMKIANRDKERTYDDTGALDRSGKERNERNKEHDMWRKAVKLPAIQKDADLVTEMNKAIKPLLQDPDYNLDVDFDDDENYLDEGAFGSVYLGDDGNVIKKGMIGPDELKALAAMKDNPRFPSLINARFDSPFKHMSSYENNPMNADNERRQDPRAAYWDPDEQSDFEDKYPGAEGTYAMTQAKGQQLFNVFDNLDEETRDKAMRNFWKARGDLHKAGFSHNDMHGGNIFVDDDGEVNIIDLGLAKDDPRSALMEALGGMDFEQGEDYQLTGHVSGAQLPERLMDTFNDNRRKVEEMLQDETFQDLRDYDDYDADRDYSPTFDRQFDSIYDMLRGGIRMTKDDLNQLGEDIPFLKDDNNVRKLIKMLYDEVGQSELADRMSDAFSKRQQDSRVIRTANQVRARRGEKPINVTNRNVVPPENLDFDD